MNKFNWLWSSMTYFFITAALCQIAIGQEIKQSVLSQQIPEKRWTHQLVYDENEKQCLLFGGSSDQKLLNDLWAYNGTWHQLSNHGPSARNKAVFVHDPLRNKTVLFGGNVNDQNVDDTWEWNGTTWKKIEVKGPAARVHALGVYDRKNKVILIFGGFGSKGSLTDTWAYDGISWKVLDETGPTACLPHGLVYDNSRQKVIMITLENNSDSKKTAIQNDLWEWTGHHWKKIASSTPLTTSRSLQAVSSFGQDGIILYDGDDVSRQMGKTWTFANQIWTNQYISGPGARVGHAMVFDNVRNRVVLFGGSNRSSHFNDTWEWDGKEWKEIR